MELDRRRFLAGLAGLAASAPGLGCASRELRSACPASEGFTEEPDPVEAPAEFKALEGFCAGAEAIAAEEFEARLASVRGRLGSAGQGALIVEAGPDMRYLGGPRWGLSERPLLLVVPREAEAFMIGPAFERRSLDARRGALDFVVETWDEHMNPYALVEAGLRRSAADAKLPLAFAGATRSFVVDGMRQAAPGRHVSTSQGVIEGCRRVKSAAELALLRRANEATKAAIARAASHARVGMHEWEFAAIIRRAQESAGLEGVWVLALFGPNAAFPHGTPEGRELAADDLILVDTGGFLHGYASDITRTWAFPDPGAIDAERGRAWEVVRAAQSAALELIGPGARCAEVDAAARAVIAAAGFDPDYGDFSHRLGHGIGLEVHEPPYLVRDAAQELEPGNTMSVEPGLYLPGRYGVRLEDIVVVTEAGAEVFGARATSLEDPFGAGA